MGQHSTPISYRKVHSCLFQGEWHGLHLILWASSVLLVHGSLLESFREEEILVIVVVVCSLVARLYIFYFQNILLLISMCLVRRVEISDALTLPSCLESSIHLDSIARNICCQKDVSKKWIEWLPNSCRMKYKFFNMSSKRGCIQPSHVND